MFDERQFIARVEATDPDEFREIMASPTPEEARALRVYLGDERYQRMHIRAIRRQVGRRGAPQDRGNVVVLHGVMGSELSVFDRSGDGDNVWVNLLRIASGRLRHLRLGDDGLSDASPGADVRVTGILKRYYGELLLALSDAWNVRAFWYDWRKDVNVAADELQAQLSGWFGDAVPVHLVAHSMGGLVARSLIANHPRRWRTMWDAGDATAGRVPGTHGGRLVMLGTPNHGSFAIPQAIVGLDDLVQKLTLIDIRHNLPEILEILNSFVGSFQMLPSPIALPEMAPLYEPATWGDLNIVEARLANARAQHEALRDVVDPERMVYVAGTNRATYDDIDDFKHLDRKESYGVTWAGDGRVPHRLGMLATADGRPVPAYYVDEDHGGLPENARILAALDELLTTGATTHLDDTSSVTRRRDAARGAQSAARAEIDAIQAEELGALESLLTRSRTWRTATTGLSTHSGEQPAGASVSDATGIVSFASTDERRIEETLARGILTGRPGHGPVTPLVPFDPAVIEIRVVGGGLDDLDRAVRATADGADHRIDVIAVGHYLGQKPEGAELALDVAISRPPGRRPAALAEADLLISQLAERGTIRGELGQIFLLPDPRADGGADRVIAIAGMGVPGRFGEPELAVVSRELCWALGRLGKRHLATVLIGSGQNNLNPADAALAWIHGIKNAITGSVESEARTLRRVTFVERDPAKLVSIQDAIAAEAQRLRERNRLAIDFLPLGGAELGRVTKAWVRAGSQRDEDIRRKEEDAPETLAATRMTATLEGGVYNFGAITEGASIPERHIPLDPTLVRDANDELAGAWDIERQYERGRFLGQLLFPADFRAQLTTAAPLVLLLDATVARVHWEMVAQHDDDFAASPVAAHRSVARFASGNGPSTSEFDPRRFLGTSRGVTRQLRTTFAPPPQPPPPPRRLLRVLVVADPAEDNRLPGAEAEGAAVADLFERFNLVHEGTENRIEVVKLLGPQEATRTNVLRELMQRSYDVLHFAGHCTYDRERPDASGWIFSNATRITANELNRIDRIPGFIFSNACESGITPDRAELRSVELAPSFAESFFARGVANFVCTAWPVDDLAAQQFALTLYDRLLGMRALDERRRQFDAAAPAQMHLAMRDARLAILETPSGAQTWGAYQHYGNPYLRFFDPVSMAASSGNRR